MPPWEAEQAAAALAEAKARDALAGAVPQSAPAAADTDGQSQREALVLEFERRTRTLEQEVEQLNHAPGSLSGLSGNQLLYAVMGWWRRPEWLILAVALFCFAMWFIAYTLRQWLTMLLEVSRATGR